MVWHYIGVLCKKHNITWLGGWRLFSSRIEKYFTHSVRSLVKYVNTCPNKQADKQTKEHLKYQQHELKQTGHTEEQLACLTNSSWQNL